MTTVYPGIDSPEFREGFSSYTASVDDLVALFDRYDIAEKKHSDVDEVTVRAIEEVLEALSLNMDSGITLRAYIMSFVATDSRNAAAQAKMSELSQRTVLLSQLVARFT